MRPSNHRSSSTQLWFAILIALVVASLLAGLGMRSPTPPDEPRFVLAARHMVETGQWLLPHRGSELYAEKPPTFMWIQAGTYKLLGSWNLSFLLPSLLAALLTLWLTWDMARRLWNPRVARYAVLALFVTLQFGLMAKRAQIDMVLVGMTTLALWGLVRHLLLGPSWGALALAAFAAGVGTVTKGVGFLPLLMLVPWVIWRWRHPQAAGPGHGTLQRGGIGGQQVGIRHSCPLLAGCPRWCSRPPGGVRPPHLQPAFPALPFARLAHAARP